MCSNQLYNNKNGNKQEIIYTVIVKNNNKLLLKQFM